MKTNLFPVFFLFCTVVSNAQTKVDTLTNEKIIQLSKIGLQPSIIINKIQTSVPKFDVSTDGLIALSKEGVSSDVINEMMKFDAQKQKEIASQRDMRDPKTMRKAGIYYYNSIDSAKLFRRLEPTVISQVSSGGMMHGGIIKSKVKSTLAGSKSRQQIDEDSPIFYFYFETNSNLNTDNWFFASATSPNEFVLVQLDENKNNREAVVGWENSYKSSIGVPDKDKIAFEFENVAEGIYKVHFNKPLKKGEYCFIYGSATPTNQNNDKVFDFGIQNQK